MLRSPPYTRIFETYPGRIYTAISHCCKSVCVLDLKPFIARVRRERLTHFYPLTRGQPYPLCALRRKLVREHAPSVKSVASATRHPHGHAHFKPSIISFVVALLRYLADSDWLQLRAFGYHAVLKIAP